MDGLLRFGADERSLFSGLLRVRRALLPLLCLLGSLGGTAWAQQPQLAPPPPLAPAAPLAPPAGGGLAPALADPGVVPVGELAAAQETAPASSEVNPETCEGTNRAFWVGIVGFDVLVMFLFFFPTFWLVSRKNWLPSLGGGFLRFLVLLLPFALSAFLLITLIRPEVLTVARCLEDAELRTTVAFSAFSPWQIGLLLGALPVLVLTTLSKMVHGLVTR